MTSTATTTYNSTYSSIVLTVNAQGIACLTINCPGKANVLNHATMEELGSAAVEIANSPQIKAVILRSSKPNMFASGADLREILEFKNQSEAYQMVKRGQEVFARLTRLQIPLVAAIHGMCLGGGLELALCTHHRIATIDGTTQLGLPEVSLGLLPGLGGTQRLPRLIGLKPALDLILSGKPVLARQAYDLGLVDEVVELAQLDKRAEEIALALSTSSGFNKPDALLSTADKNKTILATSQRAVRIRTRGNYPAFNKAIEAIAEGINNGMEVGLEAEARAFSELAPSDTARNLINLFFAQELAVRLGSKGEQKPGAGPTHGVKYLHGNNAAVNLLDVGIVGAGLMGSGIAYLAADNGYQTHLVETDAGRLTAAMETIRKRLASPVQVEGTSPVQVGEASSLPPHVVHAMHTLEGLNQAQVVIEAINEDLEAKIELFHRLEQVVPDSCLLASNTSCLSITQIANSLTHGNRLLGMHFFHPVERMPLVEVILHPGVDRQIVDKAMSLAVKLGKVPVLVNDGPGFLVNRILCPYLIESALIAEEGVPLSWIEEAAISFGMPMGPLALMDEISLDISFKVARLLHESFDGRLPLPELMHKMESLGLLGKKNNSGFYSYDESGARKSFNTRLVELAGLKTSAEKLPELHTLELQQRLILPMIDEAVRCLSEKVVRKPRDIDLAMVLGTGFPGFRGGLLRYADSLGATSCVELLKALYAARRQHKKITVPDLLVSMSEDGRRFY